MPPTPENLTRRDALKSLFAAGLVAGTVRPALGAEPATPPRSSGLWRLPPESKSWAAHWITHPDAVRAAQGVYLFRTSLTLDTVPLSLPVKVSADQRFKLFVNGSFIGSGPALSDPWHWRYERFDLATALRPGVNVIAAVVWYGEARRTRANGRFSRLRAQP